MFKNIGVKIKKLAIIVCVIQALLSILLALIVCNNIEKEFIVVLFIFIGIVTLGILLGWISAMFVYAFGQLVDNSDMITHILHSQINDQKEDMKAIFNKDFFRDDTSPMSTNEFENNLDESNNATPYIPNDL